MKHFSKINQNQENLIIENNIQEIKSEVEKRSALFAEMKRLYNPNKDKKYSNLYYFLNSSPKLTKISKKDIKDYQDQFKIKLPQLIIRMLTEIGSGGLINHHFLNEEGKLFKPTICIEDEFLQRCVEEQVAPQFIENELIDTYNFEKNTFDEPEVQAVYESFQSNRDKNITVLFALGGHDSYLTLNRENNKEVAIFDVPGISNKTFKIDTKSYESPYFKYMDYKVNSAILGNINTSYWRSLIDEIKQMNSM